MSGALDGWLAEHCPEGSPALRCWPHGQEYVQRLRGQEPGTARTWGPDLFGVEVVLPLAASSDSRSGAERCRALVRRGRPLPGPSAALIQAALCSEPDAPGVPRLVRRGPEHGDADGAALLGALPPGTPTVVVSSQRRRFPTDRVTATSTRVQRRALPLRAGRQGQRHTAPLRAIYAAVTADLLDLPMADVGRFVLRQANGAAEDCDDMASSHRSGGGAYAKRAEGRGYLAELGCWPWALYPHGRLSRTWRRDLLA